MGHYLSPPKLTKFYDVTWQHHYNDVIMTTVTSQITSLTVVYSTVYSDADQRKHQSSASLAFVWGIHRDRWIPRTKGQLHGKCFHLMTSSWLGHNGLIMISIITWLCDILALVWHFGPAYVTFRPGLCDILALSCVTKASACHHTSILTTGAVYREFHRSSVSKTT